ncbi:hypothetical protein PG985_006717 [Apiospora marii]|uniref:Uncharacterized protein n=1 Tax=Apiospora marii TaxID=335849 RepID=A0ABR1S9U4_9PEZI
MPEEAMALPQWTETELLELETLSIPVIVDRQKKLAAAQWVINLCSQLRTDMATYATSEKFSTNSHRRRNFEMMVHKLFFGEEWEASILRTIRIDLRLLCCVSFVPAQLKQLNSHGLSGHFGVLLERLLTGWEVPQWLLERFELVVRRYKGPIAEELLKEYGEYMDSKQKTSKDTQNAMSIAGLINA